MFSWSKGKIKDLEMIPWTDVSHCRYENQVVSPALNLKNKGSSGDFFQSLPIENDNENYKNEKNYESDSNYKYDSNYKNEKNTSEKNEKNGNYGTYARDDRDSNNIIIVMTNGSEIHVPCTTKKISTALFSLLIKNRLRMRRPDLVVWNEY